MPWYFFSLICVALSPGYSLTQKWALNLKINKTKLLTYTFIGLFVCYLVYNLTDLAAFQAMIQSPYFYIWGLLVASLSMAGNIFSVSAVEKSPNPGYVQSVNATNALIVLIASVFLFHASITWLKLVGVLLILLGLYVLLITKGKEEKSSRWQVPAVLAMLCFGGMFLVVKQMANLGITSAQTLLILFFYASIGFLALGYFQKTGLRLQKSPKIIIIPIAIGIFVAFFTNLLNFMAIKLVSNPGYSTAVFNSAVVLTLILSPLVFPKDSGGEFNVRKWLGVAITIGGVILVILG